MNQLLAAIAGLALLTGCGATGPAQDLCLERGEFSSKGCAIVNGTVADSSGSSIGGIIVGPRYPGAETCCTTSSSTSGSEGRYSFRINWVEGGLQDSVLIYVHAQTPPAGALDSVLAWVRFANVGEAPPVTTVDLVLSGSD